MYQNVSDIDLLCALDLASLVLFLLRLSFSLASFRSSPFVCSFPFRCHNGRLWFEGLEVF